MQSVRGKPGVVRPRTKREEASYPPTKTVIHSGLIANLNSTVTAGCDGATGCSCSIAEASKYLYGGFVYRH